MFAHLIKQVDCVFIFSPPSDRRESSFESVNNNNTFLPEGNNDGNLDVSGRYSSETTIFLPRLPSNRVGSTLSKRDKYQVEKEDEDTVIRRKRRKNISFDSDLDVDRLYCPYKRCNFSSFQGMEALFSHIQAYHDYRFPLYDPQIVSPCIQTPDNCIVDLKDASNKMVEPGQHLVVRGSGNFHCPYKNCIWSTFQASCIIPHLRTTHYIPIPPLRRLHKKYYLSSSRTRRKVDPSYDINSKILEDGEPIRLVNQLMKKDVISLLSPSPLTVTNYQQQSSIETDTEQRQRQIDEAISLPPITHSNKSRLPLSSRAIVATSDQTTSLLSLSSLSPIKRKRLPKHKFQCPYTDCIYGNSARSMVLEHIRSKHDHLFPKNIQYNRKFVFKSQAGRIVHLDGSTKIGRNERINVEYDDIDTKVRKFCPYEMCDSSSKTRYKLFSHIRNEHDPGFPYTKKTNIPFIVRTSSGKQVHFTSDQRTVISKDEKLSFVYKYNNQQSPSRYHCPYKDCIRSASLETRLYEHIREVHDSHFPRVQLKTERIITTLNGEKVDFSPNPRRRRLDPEEKIMFLYKHSKANEAGFRCPYYGCVIRNAKRSRIYQHVREVHDSHFPKLCGTYKRYIIKSKLTNRNIDFKDQFMRKGDSIEVFDANH